MPTIASRPLTIGERLAAQIGEELGLNKPRTPAIVVAPPRQLLESTSFPTQEMPAEPYLDIVHQLLSSGPAPKCRPGCPGCSGTSIARLRERYSAPNDDDEAYRRDLFNTIGPNHDQ